MNLGKPEGLSSGRGGTPRSRGREQFGAWLPCERGVPGQGADAPVVAEQQFRSLTVSGAGIKLRSI